MAEQMTNIGMFAGELDAEAASASTNPITIILYDGITATLSTDKVRWIDGYVTFTAELNNESGEAFETVDFDIQLNATLVNIVAGSVTVDGAESADYTFSGGLLTVPVGSIATGGTVIVTFQVEKV